MSVASNDLGNLCQEPWAVQAFDDEVEGLHISSPTSPRGLFVIHGSLWMPERQTHCKMPQTAWLATWLQTPSRPFQDMYSMRPPWQTCLAEQVLYEGLRFSYLQIPAGHVGGRSLMSTPGLPDRLCRLLHLRKLPLLMEHCLLRQPGWPPASGHGPSEICSACAWPSWSGHMPTTPAPQRQQITHSRQSGQPSQERMGCFHTTRRKLASGIPSRGRPAHRQMCMHTGGSQGLCVSCQILCVMSQPLVSRNLIAHLSA